MPSQIRMEPGMDVPVHLPGGTEKSQLRSGNCQRGGRQTLGHSISLMQLYNFQTRAGLLLAGSQSGQRSLQLAVPICVDMP